MPTLDDVRAICRDLPEVEETLRWGRASWAVAGKGFVWDRPFSKADVRRDGAPPPGELLGGGVVDEADKQALLRAEPDWFLTISHFANYPAVLLRLEAVPGDRLREIVIEAWYASAPPAVAAAHPDLA